MRGVLLPWLLLAASCLERSALDDDALLDPVACQSCHPDQYREWSASMHAYSSDDPIFVALNAYGQRTTDGALGDFCVQCHAPMAVRLGLTRDGSNLDQLDRRYLGITCYACHQIDGVLADHNNGLALAGDDGFRGGLADPLETDAHRSIASALLDGRTGESAAACGSCHDVVNRNGAYIERTFGEWQASIFGQPGPTQLSCAGCHMPGRAGRAAEVDGAVERRVHDHGMPGLDTALGRWPGIEVQAAGIRRDLDGAIATRLCVVPGPGGVHVEVTLDNLLVGHAFPSGATHARRAWVELIATRGDQVMLQSGVVADGQAVAQLDDPNLWLLWSRMLDADERPVAQTWLASREVSELLPPATTNDPSDPAYNHAVTRSYPLPATPDRVALRVLVRPVGLELLDDLIAAGDLDPEVRDRLPTHALAGAARVWTSDLGLGCVTR